MDIERIRQLLKETGRSQRDLAAHLGVDPAAITRLLSGRRRLRLDEAPKVEAFFGLTQSRAAAAAGSPAPAPNVDLRPRQPAAGGEAGPRDLPVYASAQGGPDGMVIDYEPIEWMRRPQALEGVVDAFAFYVVGDSMAPRFRHGERLLVHPRRPPGPGDDVLLILRDGRSGGFNAMVKQLVRRTPDGVRVAQHNPAKSFDIAAEDVDRMLLIVGTFFYG